jgi:hypothetical protein
MFAWSTSARGIEQAPTFVIIDDGLQESTAAPRFHSRPGYAQTLGDLAHVEEASLSETVVSALQVVCLPDQHDRLPIQSLAHPRSISAFVEDRCDILVGMVVNEAIDLGNNGSIRLAQPPGGQRERNT